MPWEYLLSGATGAGILFVFLILFFQKFMERIVDNRFEIKIESYKNELLQKLEEQKTELAVWFELRKDILLEIWNANKMLITKMNAVILSTQIKEPLKNNEVFDKALEEYRTEVHAQINFLDEKTLEICQEFLEGAYTRLGEKTKNIDIENRLKQVRMQMRDLLYKKFGIEKMMPSMVTKN